MRLMDKQRQYLGIFLFHLLIATILYLFVPSYAPHPKPTFRARAPFPLSVQ